VGRKSEFRSGWCSCASPPSRRTGCGPRSGDLANRSACGQPLTGEREVGRPGGDPGRCRPRLILAMVVGRRFKRRDFVGQPDGRVRLTAPLAREVAEAVLPVARVTVAPIAEELARMLAASVSGSRSHVWELPTNLSGETRSKDSIRKRPVPSMLTTRPESALRHVRSRRCQRASARRRNARLARFR